MRKKIFIISLTTLLATAATLSSCTSKDGDWDSMIWKTEVKSMKKDGVKYVLVPQTGGTYEYTCRNYKSFWPEVVIESTEMPTGNPWQFEDLYDIYQRKDDNFYNISSPSTEVSVKDAKLTITVKPNDTGKTRYIMVTVSAGDIFDKFIYRQE